MGLISIVNTIFLVYIYIVIARVLLSWVPHDPSQPVFRFIYEITDPVMAPFSKLIPPIGGIDFSPIFVIFVIEIVRRVIISLLLGIF
ncbi:Uncharacterised protein family Ycf19 [Syntrophomonas zehnderi OL-4]|uniref:Uncharacterized protein family Ycf19 n=1 Tax=Syntrophomonas zehnderi OL-4 TaxID=690567 RepID=A0A0E4GDR6_9FIRM|nr:YggT family protein [Syntrophomonas zehnderi]CFX57476.1 Uncharacterised protein family Ycf19 [Syntrophomonas zehnderi OL-4]